MKNKRLLAGRPFGTYTIDESLSNNLLDRDMLSTGSEEKRNIGFNSSVECSFFAQTIFLLMKPC